MKTTLLKTKELPDVRQFNDLNEWLNAWEGDISDDDDDYDWDEDEKDDDDWDEEDDDDWDDDY